MCFCLHTCGCVPWISFTASYSRMYVVNVYTKCTWTLYLKSVCSNVLAVLVYALTQVCYVRNVSSDAIASSCTGYSSTRSGTTKWSHCYCVWIWTTLQDGGHVWWGGEVCRKNNSWHNPPPSWWVCSLEHGILATWAGTFPSGKVPTSGAAAATWRWSAH